ncbi:RNA-binding protein [bacterium]|nr:MAG: RNA-binding protein [bacterium]
MNEMTAKILEESLGKIVLVRLRGGKKLRGKLKGFDQHLNLLLEETEDITNAEKTRKLGTIILRGDNVIIISPSPR